MPILPRLVRILFISRIFRKRKTRRLDISTENLSEVPVGRVSEEVIPDVPPGKRTLMKPLLGAYIRRPILRTCLSESDLAITTPKQSFFEQLIERLSREEPLSVAPIERPVPKEAHPEPYNGRLIAQENVSEAPIEIHIRKELLPESSIESEAKSTERAKRRQPRAPAQNNRILALPVELRLQIYEELLAIPRTVYMLEKDRYEESHLHKVRKFDKDCFCSRSLLRYKFVSPCVGYYDPRTTTFAARFSDDDACIHRIWASETQGAGQGVPTSAQQIISPVDPTSRPRGGIHLVFPVCSAAAQRQNALTWGEIHEQLCHGPKILILELEFPKLCSLITVLKGLLLGHLPGWRELRNLSVVRLRLRSGNGGPLNVWEMACLWSLATNWQDEMQRKVLLRRGPRIEMAW